MSDPNFDWSTEDHADWDSPQIEATSSNSRLRLPISLIVCALVVVVAGILMWQLRGQVQEASAQFEVEARASAELLYDAALKEDLELFSTVTSGLDMDWVGQQQQAVANSTLFGRTPFGLEWNGIAPQITAVSLDEVLTTAEVTATIGYDVHGQSTTLQLPITLRKGTSKWLYAPPLEAFWGEQENIRATHLIATFPARDTQIIQRLVPDLNQIVRNSGSVEFGNIQPERQMFLEFSTDPVYINNPPARSIDESLVLATPSLIGVPVDEVGYQALLRYYISHVYLPVMAARDLYSCCEQAVWFEAIADWELSRAGVINWPLSAETYTTITNDSAEFNNRLSSWFANDSNQVSLEERQLAYAIVQVIGDGNPSLLPRDMLSALAQSESFTEWMDRLLSAEMTFPEDPLGNLLRSYQNGDPDSASRPPLPQEQIALACESVDGGGSIYALDWDASRWGTWRVIETLTEPAVYMHDLPGHRGLWIEEQENSASLWRNGVRTLLPDDMRYFGQHSPNGEQLVVRRVGIDGRLDDRTGVMALDNCSADNCPLEAYLGEIIWSPDGTHRIVRDFGNRQTYVVDEAGSQVKVVNSGDQFTQPVWLNNNTIAWLIDNASFVKGTLEFGDVLPWITYEELWNILPDHATIESPGMRAIHAGSPNDTNNLILTVFDDTSPKHIIGHSPDLLTTTLFPSLDNSFYIDTSPQGGVIAAGGYDLENIGGGLTNIALHSLRTNETIRYDFNGRSKLHFLDSSDEWVMIYDQEQIRLIAPHIGLERQILPPASNCSAAAWLNLNSQ